MTAIIRAGERGVDFSFARPLADRLLELGYSFIVGYVSVAPAAPAKNITRQQCQGYLAAGIKILIVWEMSASRANLGASYGTADGANARVAAANLSYPTDVPILVADDTNTTAFNLRDQEAYMRAFAAACWPYPIGIYGDTEILARCEGLWRIGWLPNAWAWSGSSRANAEAKAKALGAHVLQHKGFYIDDIWAVDPNTAIADFPAWGTTTSSSEDVQGDDMATVITNSEPHRYTDGVTYPPKEVKWALLDTQHKVHLGVGHLAYGSPAGFPMTNDQLDTLPDYVAPTAGPAGAAAPTHGTWQGDPA
ncbi:MAG: glycoside hydrolase domain-containing protein [Ilumatobacteraceae bacterium]